MDTWWEVGQVLNIKDKVRNQFLGKKISAFSGLTMGEKEGKEERSPRLLSAILGVPSIGIRRAKN